MSLGSEGGVPAVMSVTPTGGTGYNNGGWGGDWGAWIILFLVFSMFGWGGFGGGWGGGNGGSAATQADIQRGFDTSSIISKLDGINSGLCDGFYAMNTGMLQGFNSVNQGLCNLGYQTQQGFNSTQVAMMQGNNAIQAQLADCCCTTARAIDGVNYNMAAQAAGIQNAIQGVRYDMATQACDTRNTIQTSTRDIIDNQTSGINAIMGKLSQMEYNGLNDKYQAALAENQALRLAASQSNQNAVLMAAMDANKAEILRRTGAECPTPAYVVQPPTPVNFPANYCGQFSGWNNGCGCNSGCGC